MIADPVINHEHLMMASRDAVVGCNATSKSSTSRTSAKRTTTVVATTTSATTTATTFTVMMTKILTPTNTFPFPIVKNNMNDEEKEMEDENNNVDMVGNDDGYAIGNDSDSRTEDDDQDNDIILASSNLPQQSLPPLQQQQQMRRRRPPQHHQIKDQEIDTGTSSIEKIKKSNEHNRFFPSLLSSLWNLLLRKNTTNKYDGRYRHHPKYRAICYMTYANAIQFASYECARIGTMALFTSNRYGFQSVSAVSFATGFISPFSIFLLWVRVSIRSDISNVSENVGLPLFSNHILHQRNIVSLFLIDSSDNRHMLHCLIE
jgi:hypothetical protein